MIYSVDRLEPDAAVLVSDRGETRLLPYGEAPFPLREGMLLHIGRRGVQPLARGEQMRRRRLERRLQELLNRGKNNNA